MPIYEYECTQCGDEFEMIQSFSDKPLKKCKKCGGKLHKLVSQSSFHLKGSGWYVTDYSSSAKPGSKPTKVKSEESKPTTESKPDESGSKSTSKAEDKS